MKKNILFLILFFATNIYFNLSAEDIAYFKDGDTTNQKIENTSKFQKKIPIEEIESDAKEEPMEFRQVFSIGAEANTDMLQDRDGFLWFSSYIGLVKYNGYDVKYYKAGLNSLTANAIVDLFEDSDGLIWIGTKDGGINSYNKKTDKFTQYKNNPEDDNSLSSNVIIQESLSKILEDKDGYIWIATLGGLNRLDKKTTTFKRYLNEPNNADSLINDKVFTIAIDEKNDSSLWIGTENGLDKLNTKTDKFIHYKHKTGDESSLSDNEIFNLVSEPNGDLWIGTGKGVDKYNSETGKFTFIKSLPAEKAWSMAKFGNDLFISYFTKKQSLVRYNTETGKITEYKSNSEDKKSLSTGSIKNVYKDKNGAYWVINTPGLIDKFDPKEKKFKVFKKGKGSLNDGVAFPRLEDKDGYIWIGTLSHGPTRYDREKGTFKHYTEDIKKTSKSLPNNYASSIFEDSNGEFWLGTWGGLVKYNKESAEAEKIITEINNAYSIHEDDEDSDILWISTYQYGFFKYNKKTDEFKNFKHDKNNPDSIAHDISLSFIIDKEDSNIMWIAQHGGGLDKFNKKTEKFYNYSHDPNDENTISSNSVWSVYQDSKSNLWVLTDEGLDKLDRETGIFEHFTKGFPGKITNIAIEDDIGNLWVATEGGLVKFNIDSEEVTRVYTTRDGLQSHAFFAQGMIKTKDGEIFLGGGDGLNTFYPEKLKDNDFKPPVYLTSLEQGGKPIKTDSALEKVDEIVLDSKNNFFEFKYAALNYTNPSKNRYKYILEGWDKGWFDAGTTRQARYTGLNPGMYVLKIMGANNDGLWSDNVAKLNVNVKPDLEDIPLQFTLDELKNTDEILLGHNNDQFTFEVAPLDYSIVEDNRYSYMLEGYDKEWINSANKRYAHYNQVPAGNYNLKVREEDNTVLDVNVIINPPFYSTLWFRTVSIVALLILLLIIYLLRTRTLRRKHVLLEKIVAERTEELTKQSMELEKANIKISEDSKDLQKANSEISKRSKELTKQSKELQKTNEELEISKDKAETATKAKSEFLANMSHEIRTPMNAILGFSELLLNKEVNPKSKRFLNTIFSSGNSLLRLINDILDLSKIEAGKMEIQYKATSIQSIFNELGLVFAQKLQEKHLDFILDVQKGIPEVLLLDETRLRQILTNLMGNSIKFTENGFIKLSVKYSNPRSSKSLLNLDISVEDSGIGIPEKDQKTIFDSFTQVKGQSVKKFGGTGLGLAISKRLIEAMHGTVSLESKEGKGTIFNIKLNNVEITALTAQTDCNGDFNPASIKFKHAKILIADDIEYNRELLMEFFADYDFEIFEADDGVKAVEQVKKHNPDLLLLDLKMPVMNGYEVADALRSDQNLKNIKIVILSASPIEKNSPHLKKICDSYLRKPVGKGLLVQVLMKLLPYETVEVKADKEHDIKKIIDKKLLLQIKTNVQPIIDELIERQSIRKLETLAQECLKLGTSFNNEILVNFSKQLSLSMKEYNLDVLDELVAGFKNFI